MKRVVLRIISTVFVLAFAFIAVNTNAQTIATWC